MALTRLSLAVETASLQVDAFISAPKRALPPVAILVGKIWKNDECTAIVLRILLMWLEASRYFLFSRLLAILLAHI